MSDTGARVDTSAESDIARIAEQEVRLRFASFTADTAWDLGVRLRALAAARSAAVAIEVRIARETVFFFAMPGTSPANADWARRKRNTVELLEQSSYRVGLSLALERTTLEAKMGLPVRDYASHGGSMPVVAANGTLAGVVTVSGMPQRIDHCLVVEAMAAVCGIPLPAIELR